MSKELKSSKKHVREKRFRDVVGLAFKAPDKLYVSTMSKDYGPFRVVSVDVEEEAPIEYFECGRTYWKVGFDPAAYEVVINLAEKHCDVYL